MVGPRGAVEALDVLGLLPLEDARDPQHADDVVAEDQRGAVADAQLLGFGVGHREGDRRRPGVAAEAELQRVVVEDGVPGLLVHRPLERRERAVGDAVDRGEIGARHLDARQRRRLAEELPAAGERNGARHRGVEPAVDGNEIGHGSLLLAGVNVMRQRSGTPMRGRSGSQASGCVAGRESLVVGGLSRPVGAATVRTTTTDLDPARPDAATGRHAAPTTSDWPATSQLNEFCGRDAGDDAGCGPACAGMRRFWPALRTLRLRMPLAVAQRRDRLTP